MTSSTTTCFKLSINGAASYYLETGVLLSHCDGVVAFTGRAIYRDYERAAGRLGLAREGGDSGGLGGRSRVDGIVLLGLYVLCVR